MKNSNGDTKMDVGAYIYIYIYIYDLGRSLVSCIHHGYFVSSETSWSCDQALQAIDYNLADAYDEMVLDKNV